MTSNCGINANELRRMPKEEPASYFQLLSRSIPPEIEKKKEKKKDRKKGGKKRKSIVSRVSVRTEIRNHSLPITKNSTATFSEFN